MAIYFFQRKDGMVKVGYSESPLQRKKQLQYKHGRLTVLGWFAGDMLTETEIHRALTPFRHKNEWYHPDKQLLDFIKLNTSEIALEDVHEFLYTYEKKYNRLMSDYEDMRLELERYRAWHNRAIESDLSEKPVLMIDKLKAS